MARSRLQWRCRRGTKELDVVLQRFLDEVFPKLSEAERDTFESLLEQQDPDLAAWIWGGVPPPAQWAGVIGRIRTLIGKP